jgi:hypothetical protein
MSLQIIELVNVTNANIIVNRNLILVPEPLPCKRITCKLGKIYLRQFAIDLRAYSIIITYTPC